MLSRLFTVGFVLLLVSPALGQQPKSAAPPAAQLKTLREKASYAIGLNIGRSIKQDEIDIDVNLLAKGILDAMKGAKPLLTDDQVRATMDALQKQAVDKLKAPGLAFLEKNKKVPGVKTLPDGLQYAILKLGNGATPKATDRVRVHYKGTLIDGKEFDSSYKRGKPAEFPVNGVIEGWTKTLQMMKVGGKWKIFVPQEMGYGARGAPGGVIGPYQVLVFDIELLGIIR